MKHILLGYIAGWSDWSGLPLERDAARLTHICYAFANIKDGEVVLFTERTSDQSQPRAVEGIAHLRGLRSRHPHLKLLISIGGWEAEGFSDAALTENSRAQFAASAIRFMHLHGFDGIDLDWEYPSNDMAGIKARPEDKQNFTRLLAELRRQLNAESKAHGETYLLTIAAGAGQYYLDGVEMPAVAELCDFVNLMTYDFYNGWATRAGHHSNLFNTPIDPEGDSCAKSVALFTAHGLPANKLVLGCAFYGRSLIAPALGEAGVAKSNGSASYSKIVHELILAGAVRHWDETAKAPWLMAGERFVSYEDEVSIAHKMAFVKQQGLAGAFFWEYSEDRDGVLMDALWEGLQYS
jgi:chitinase